MAWLKCEDKCKPNKDVGVGVKDLLAFSEALLSKWVWRFFKENENL